MRSAYDYVYHVRMFFYDFRKSAQDNLYPLMRSQEPECQERCLAFNSILVFVKIGINKRNVWYSVRNQSYLRSVHLIYCLKNVDSFLSHYNHIIGQGKQFIHNASLARRWILQYRMQGRYDRHLQLA